MYLILIKFDPDNVHLGSQDFENNVWADDKVQGCW